MDEADDNHKNFKFRLLKKDKATKARLGKLTTPRGIIDTPNFNPVGTQATVKSLSALDLKEIGAQIVLANAYHLHLRPGEDLIEKFGGVARFMGWTTQSHFAKASRDGKTFQEQDLPTMTDSGGFQVFSLGAAHQAKGKLTKFTSKVFVYEEPGIVILNDVKDLKQERDSSPLAQNDIFLEDEVDKADVFLRQAKRKPQVIKPARIDENGVTFFSHLDGSQRRLSPEISIRIQEKLGADLIVAFDDHESPTWDFEETKLSLERTNRWGIESLLHHKRKDQLMYGVVHGGIFEDLRKASAQFTDKNFAAIAIGGAYTSKEILYKVLDWTLPLIDENKPRHLLGIGEFVDIFEGVARGVDFFDCVAPSRRGRHGNVYISPKTGGNPNNKFCLTITNSQYKDDEKPIDPTCECKTCQNFSRAYIHHLFRADELVGYRLATYHNVYFITKTMEKIRNAIGEGSFEQMKKEWMD